MPSCLYSRYYITIITTEYNLILCKESFIIVNKSISYLSRATAYCRYNQSKRSSQTLSLTENMLLDNSEEAITDSHFMQSFSFLLVSNPCPFPTSEENIKLQLVKFWIKMQRFQDQCFVFPKGITSCTFYNTFLSLYVSHKDCTGAIIMVALSLIIN